MKNKSCLLATIPFMSGCTHIGVASFDKTQNTVTVQGSKWAKDEDYQKEAEKYCQGPATLQSMNQRTVGSYTQANVQNYGSYANGQATTKAIQRYDRTFTCGQ